MANNLRYLLEHFCLDGQKIDVSSQLDEENADNIAKINTQTIPSINARIDDIKNTDIPNISSRIDNIKNSDIPNINRKINTINNTTIPNVQASVTAVDEKADRINESVTKNTRDIGTLSDNVTMQGNAINSIKTEKIPSVEDNIEKINAQTIPSINARIDEIKDTDIPNINSQINSIKNTDIPSINQKINTINNTTIPNVQASVIAVDEKADRINKSATKNTGDIGNLTTSINGLTTKVNTNTDTINGLTTKVNTDTDSINRLTTKVNTNTNSINTNTNSINTINNTSIPRLQSEIDSLRGGTIEFNWVRKVITPELKIDGLRTQIIKYACDPLKLAYITIAMTSTTDFNIIDTRELFILSDNKPTSTVNSCFIKYNNPSSGTKIRLFNTGILLLYGKTCYVTDLKVESGLFCSASFIYHYE